MTNKYKESSTITNYRFLKTDNYTEDDYLNKRNIIVDIYISEGIHRYKFTKKSNKKITRREFKKWLNQKRLFKNEALNMTHEFMFYCT